jgi:hypothetical protein
MRILLLIFMIVTVGHPAFAQDRSALVTSFSGAGSYTRWGDVKPLHSVLILEPDDVVELKSGATAHLSFFKGGHVAIAKGPTKLKMTSEGSMLLSGTQPQRKNRDGSTIVPAGANLERMAGTLLFSKGLPEKGSPICGFARTWTSNPVIRWSDGTPPFQITVFDQMGETVWSATTDSRSLPYAGPELTPDKDYTAQIQSRELTNSGNFRLLSKETQDKISITKQWAEDLLAKEPNDPTPLVLLMTLYNENEMLDEAIALAQKGTNLFPNDAGIHIALANLLDYVDRYEEAREPRRRAEELLSPGP